MIGNVTWCKLAAAGTCPPSGRLGHPSAGFIRIQQAAQSFTTLDEREAAEAVDELELTSAQRRRYPAAW